MCLSTVYKNSKTLENIVMKNVMRLECQGDTVIITDLMERQVVIQGRLAEANLVDGIVLVQETA